MRSTEERIDLMHAKVQEMHRVHDKKLITVLGGASVLMALILIVFTAYMVGAPGAITDTAMAGTSMLSESAGGYVLVAVVSFIVAVMITVACLKMQQKGKKTPGKDSGVDTSGEEDF